METSIDFTQNINPYLASGATDYVGLNQSISNINSTWKAEQVIVIVGLAWLVVALVKRNFG